MTVTLAHEGETLCFSTELTVEPAETAGGAADVGQECLEAESDLADFDGPMSVSVGGIDGEGRFGYVWGRAIDAVARLSIVFEDGKTRTVPVQASGDLNIFVALIDTATQDSDVSTLDALGLYGATIDSVNIRGFLRSGPTYPVVVATTSLPPTYPTISGGGPTATVG